MTKVKMRIYLVWSWQPVKPLKIIWECLFFQLHTVFGMAWIVLQQTQLVLICQKSVKILIQFCLVYQLRQLNIGLMIHRQHWLQWM